MLIQVHSFSLSVVFFFIGIGLFTCQDAASPPEISQDPYTHIADQEAKSILQQAMEAMGGLERWNSKQEIRFSKQYELLDENGEVENAVGQLHSYTYDPEELLSITWLRDRQVHLLQQISGDILNKTVDGKTDSSANLQSLKNTLLSATFVANLPYNLLDPGADISYAGLDTLETGQVVHSIRIAYNPEAYANHSTSDIWHVYFDQNSYVMLAYMVQHADHYSYVRNLRDTLVEGFRLVQERESYRVDSLRNILYLRARYSYDAYEVRW